VGADFFHGGDIYTNKGVTLDFSVNTNPFGMPECVREALIARADEFARYPDPNNRALCEAIAKYEGVPVEFILCGNGAADLIYRLCYAVMPLAALVLAPTFSEYERALSCGITRYFLKPENQFAVLDDILDYITSDVEIIFLCHPNNPTGRLFPREILKDVVYFAARRGITVVVDECFIDFTGGASAKDFLNDAQNLVILKAFTKMYACAGLRLGYIITPDVKLTDTLTKEAQPWSVSVPASIAGIAALSCADWVTKTRELIISERSYLSGELKKLGFTVFDGDANFILLKSERPLYEPLLEKGILIRPCGNFAGLDSSYYRLAVKTREENIRLVRAMSDG